MIVRQGILVGAAPRRQARVERLFLQELFLDR